MPVLIYIAISGEAIKFTVELIDKFFDEVWMHELMAQTIENFLLNFIPTDRKFVGAGALVDGRRTAISSGPIHAVSTTTNTALE